MWLIVGLGNPGEKYEATRHNLGFMVMAELGNRSSTLRAQTEGLQGIEDSWKYKKQFNAEVLKVSPQLLLTKPRTFMNNSGRAVKAVVDFYKIPLANVVVVHDDIDLPLGKIKIRLGGSAGGHHGVESIIKMLGSDKFLRVRLGIGTLHSLRSERDRQHTDTERFVLEPFDSSEKSKVKQLIKNGTEALEVTIEQGTEVAQNRYNK